MRAKENYNATVHGHILYTGSHIVHWVMSSVLYLFPNFSPFSFLLSISGILVELAGVLGGSLHALKIGS